MSSMITMTWSLISDIIEAVADSRGVEPHDLEITLGNYVDLDALNQLTERSNTTWTLRFELPEESVTVTSDGAILVES